MRSRGAVAVFTALVCQVGRGLHAGKPTLERFIPLGGPADDVKLVGDRWEVTCEPTAMAGVIDALGRAGLSVEANEIVRIPTNTVEVEDVEMARKVLNLMERLDDHDDVQSVAANFNIPETALAQLA